MYFPTNRIYDPKIPRLRNNDSDTYRIELADAMLIERIKKAEDARTSAAYSGSMTDGGCHLNLEALKAFAYGWNHEFPPEWEGDVKKKENEQDPDYKKYLELKKRFEG